MPQISIIIPYHNEKSALVSLVQELETNLKNISAQVIWADDGSTDESTQTLLDFLKGQKNSFESDFVSNQIRKGKGAILQKAIKQVKAKTIIFMDADGQDDPKDLSKFVALAHKFDLVNGYRANRQDGIDKTLPSKIGNRIFWRGILKTNLHDVNCGYKMMSKNVLDAIPLYGDNYRFLPILAQRFGFLVGEVEVNHRPRENGSSKYGWTRLWSGFLDTLTTYFLIRFGERPLHLFGTIGAMLFLPGLLITLELGIARIFFGTLLKDRPLLWLGVLLTVLGTQIISIGLLGELFLWDRRQKSIK